MSQPTTASEPSPDGITLPFADNDEEDDEEAVELVNLLTETDISTDNDVYVVSNEMQEVLDFYNSGSLSYILAQGPTSISIEGCLAKCHALGGTLCDGDEIVFNVLEDGSISEPVIKKETGNLTPQEIQSNQGKVDAGKFKELVGLFDLGCFGRMRKSEAHNIVDTRWVITWKWIDGVLSIKCRITMRGFKDRDQSYETFAGTASRAGQRIVNTMVAQDDDMELFSFDVSQAFAKGLTFEEYARLTGQQLRAVQFRVAPSDVPLVRRIKGYEDFDPDKEVLTMLKAIYGLKDAPRAWRKRLHLALVKFGMRSLLAEPEIYVLHEEACSKTTVTYREPSIAERRTKEQAISEEKEHNEPVEALRSIKKNLLLILSTHVDDLKGGAKKELAMKLLKFLEVEFGPCKNEWKDFTHTGIEHERRPKGIFCHQWKYTQALGSLDLSSYAKQDENMYVREDTHSAYSSLLGGAAWLVLTRSDGSIYIQALQRHASKPRLKDCRRLNIVVRFLKRNKLGVWYERINSDWIRILGFTDAAFKAQEGESTGLALRGLAVLIAADPFHGQRPQGKQSATAVNREEIVHLIEWLVRRLRRVVRSTFSAELNALIDTIESLVLLQLTLHQCLCGTDESEHQLLLKMEAGALMPPIDLFVDAKSVTDAVSATDVCTPQEASLKLHLITIRDRLSRGILRSVSWCDTRDMVADALTKGSVERLTIQAAMKGRLTVTHPTLTTWGR